MPLEPCAIAVDRRLRWTTVSTRLRGGGSSPPDELTATELRVAELAAAGITNREIARAMFMSEKTVEAHVARVYRKLGIRSRAELGAELGAWMAANLQAGS